MAFDIQKYIETYAEEAREQLQALKQGLAALAANPRDAEVLSSLHRSAHTVKGGARMLKLTAINELALQLEAVLTLLRDGRVAYGPELSDPALGRRPLVLGRGRRRRQAARGRL